MIGGRAAAEMHESGVGDSCSAQTNKREGGETCKVRQPNVRGLRFAEMQIV